MLFIGIDYMWKAKQVTILEKRILLIALLLDISNGQRFKQPFSIGSPSYGLYRAYRAQAFPV